MTEGTQIFEIYIRATPEQIWTAITSNEFRVKYFHGGRADSSWETGARLRTVGPDGDLWGDNEILQSDPPKLLSHTWRSLYDPAMAAEPTSRVTWTIEPMNDPDAARPGDYCRLTVTHDQLENSPLTAESIKGWSFILSGLKSVVESGEGLVKSW
jgi:uncharacterized protein YndB with AHSA1/START domain